MRYKVQLHVVRPEIEVDAEHLSPMKSAEIASMETGSQVMMAGYLRALANELDPERTCDHG